MLQNIMRKRVILAGLVVAYLAVINLTNYPSALAYRGLGKQVWVAVGLHHFVHPCHLEMETEFGRISTSLPTDQCYQMTEPHRMRGIWIDEFEGSRFVPDATSAESSRIGESDIWLDVESNRIEGLYDPEHETDGRVFEIEFVGRRTLYPGRHGHGASRHKVVVDQLIAARPVDARPWFRELDRLGQ